MEIFEKPAFCVLGREGSTDDGAGFVQRLWQEANTHFGEIADRVLREENGAPAGFWGAMTDFHRSFAPWADGFTHGLYLAGAEVPAGTDAPEGWTLWTVPGFRYVRFPGNMPFADALAAFAAEGFTLAGAVQEFTDPKTGESFQCFPAERL